MHDVVQQDATVGEGERERGHSGLLEVATDQLIERVEGEGARLVLHHLHVGTPRVAGCETIMRLSRDARKRLRKGIACGAIHTQQECEEQLAARGAGRPDGKRLARRGEESEELEGIKKRRRSCVIELLVEAIHLRLVHATQEGQQEGCGPGGSFIVL